MSQIKYRNLDAVILFSLKLISSYLMASKTAGNALV